MNDNFRKIVLDSSKANFFQVILFPLVLASEKPECISANTRPKNRVDRCNNRRKFGKAASTELSAEIEFS